MMDAHGLANGRHRAIMDPKMPGERTPHAVSLGLDAAKQVEEYIKVRRESRVVFFVFFCCSLPRICTSPQHTRKTSRVSLKSRGAKCQILQLTADGH